MGQTTQYSAVAREGEEEGRNRVSRAILIGGGYPNN